MSECTLDMVKQASRDKQTGKGAGQTHTGVRMHKQGPQTGRFTRCTGVRGGEEHVLGLNIPVDDAHAVQRVGLGQGEVTPKQL